MEKIKREREEDEAKAKQAKETRAVEVQESRDAEEATNAKSPRAPQQRATIGAWVASKTGKKYYPSESAQAEKIKDENRVSFATEEEAQAAGFTA